MCQPRAHVACSAFLIHCLLPSCRPCSDDKDARVQVQESSSATADQISAGARLKRVCANHFLAWTIHLRNAGIRYAASTIFDSCCRMSNVHCLQCCSHDRSLHRNDHPISSYAGPMSTSRRARSAINSCSHIGPLGGHSATAGKTICTSRSSDLMLSFSEIPAADEV